MPTFPEIFKKKKAPEAVSAPAAPVTLAPPTSIPEIKAPAKPINLPDAPATGQPIDTGYWREGGSQITGFNRAGETAGWVKTTTGAVPAGQTISGNIPAAVGGRGSIRPEVLAQINQIEALRQGKFTKEINWIGQNVPEFEGSILPTEPESAFAGAAQAGKKAAIAAGGAAAGASITAGAAAALPTGGLSALGAGIAIGSAAAAAGISTFAYTLYSTSKTGKKFNVATATDYAQNGMDMRGVMNNIHAGYLNDPTEIRIAVNSQLSKINAAERYLKMESQLNNDQFLGQAGKQLDDINSWYAAHSTPGTRDLAYLKQDIAMAAAAPNPAQIQYIAPTNTKQNTEVQE
jgi:hypothetical protein